MTATKAAREAITRRLQDLSPVKRDLLLRRLSAGAAADQRIEPQAGDDAPLSYAQERVWLAHHLDESGIAYNVPVSVRLRGRLDAGALDNALENIATRHEVLRTRFPVIDGRPRQVTGEPALRVERVALHGRPETNASDAKAIAHARAALPFDVQHQALMRAALIQIAPDDHLLHLDFHHLVSDGWSLAVLFRELQTLYAQAGTSRPVPPPLGVQFRDYARWERKTIAGDRLSDLLAFWRAHLAGAPQVLDFPGRAARPETQSFRGGRHPFRIEPRVTRALRHLARREQVTLFMVLVAAFQTLLARYSGRTDFVIGTDVANRSQPETAGLIGFFVNLLVLRARLHPRLTFRAVLAHTREDAAQAFMHQEVPFSLLVEALRPARSTAYTPLVQVLFVLQNTLPASVSLPGICAELQQPDIGSCKFDIAMGLAEAGGGLDGLWNYSTALFDRATIAAMSLDYETVLTRAAERPDRTLEELTAGCAVQRRSAMRTHESASALKDRLRHIRPQPVQVARDAVVRQRPLTDGVRMPLLVEPVMDGVDVIAWARDHRAAIEEALLTHGAILFRGFALRAVADFQRLAEAICPALFTDYGDLPHEPETPKIYRSTPYPAAETIRFHNEGSHTGRWPMKQFFYCVIPAASGGQTPIADCRRMYEHLDPAIVAAFETKGLLYVRNFTDGLDVSWREFFRTEEKAVVEAFCVRHGIEYEWKSDGLRTRQRCPGTARHPRSGEPIFFNQVQLHHPSCLDPEVREWLIASTGEENLPRNVLFGDGTPISADVMAAVDEAYWANATEFLWQAHDVLLVDNMLVAHARRPFEGERKITVAMGDMMTIGALATV